MLFGIDDEDWYGVAADCPVDTRKNVRRSIEVKSDWYIDAVGVRCLDSVAIVNIYIILPKKTSVVVRLRGFPR